MKRKFTACLYWARCARLGFSGGKLWRGHSVMEAHVWHTRGSGAAGRLLATAVSRGADSASRRLLVRAQLVPAPRVPWCTGPRGLHAHQWHHGKHRCALCKRSVHCATARPLSLALWVRDAPLRAHAYMAAGHRPHCRRRAAAEARGGHRGSDCCVHARWGRAAGAGECEACATRM